jgi:hypothetical protein
LVHSLQCGPQPQHFRPKQLAQAVLIANELPVMGQSSIQFFSRIHFNNSNVFDNPRA